MENVLLEITKNYTNENHGLGKVNVMDPYKEKNCFFFNVFPPNISEKLSEFSISDVGYYHALSISKNDHYELHLIRPPNFIFFDNMFTKNSN